MTDRLTYYIANRAPRIVRRLSSQAGGEFDVTSDQSFSLLVRPLWGEETIVDAAMEKDVDKDTIFYDPGPGDFITEGLFRAWVQITLGGGVKQDTDEFEIAVLEHAPGEGVRIGAIWRAARALAPVAWDALKGYPEYGDPELQRIIDLAKLRTGVTQTAAEEDQLDPRVVDFLAKMVLVANALPAAIDIWTNVVVTQSARGNSDEVKSYPDRIAAVERQRLRYAEDIKGQATEVEAIIGSVGFTPPSPMLIGGGPMLTPDLALLGSQARHLGRRRHWEDDGWAGW